MLKASEKPLVVGKTMSILSGKPKGGKGMSAEEFVDQLQQDCLDHPALNHSYLKKFEAKKVNKDQVKIFAFL